MDASQSCFPPKTKVGRKKNKCFLFFHALSSSLPARREGEGRISLESKAGGRSFASKAARRREAQQW
jgi:hypothetical protein